MAARNTDISLTTGAAVLLTDGAVSACRVQNQSGYTITLQATASATPPASRAGGVTMSPYGTLAADMTLAQIFPGVGSGALYLWAFVDIPSAVPSAVSVSHA